MSATLPPPASVDTQPYNIWRLLYFSCECDGDRLRSIQDEFNHKGEVRIPEDVLRRYDRAASLVRAIHMYFVVVREETVWPK